MPIYTYHCPLGHITTMRRNIADRHNPVYCFECYEPETKMELVIESPAFKVKENIIDRVNRGEQLRKEMKAKGEW